MTTSRARHFIFTPFCQEFCIDSNYNIQIYDFKHRFFAYFHLWARFAPVGRHRYKNISNIICSVCPSVFLYVCLYVCMCCSLITRILIGTFQNSKSMCSDMALQPLFEICTSGLVFKIQNGRQKVFLL